MAAEVAEAREVATGEEGGDGAGVGEAIVPEVDLLAVGEKDKRCVELLGVGQGLGFSGVRIDGFLLGLEHGEGAALLVEEDGVGAFGGGVEGGGGNGFFD